MGAVNQDEFENNLTEAILKAGQMLKDKKASQGATRSQLKIPENIHEILEEIMPLIVTCVTAGQIFAKKDNIEHTERLRMSLIKEKLNSDRLETYNRQDNILVFGIEEPQKNYEQFGRETPEELDQILIDVASKVGVVVNPLSISDGFRLGKKPTGSPVVREDGSTVARPILFRLNRRHKKQELMRKKKNAEINAQDQNI